MKSMYKSRSKIRILLLAVHFISRTASTTGSWRRDFSLVKFLEMAKMKTESSRLTKPEEDPLCVAPVLAQPVLRHLHQPEIEDNEVFTIVGPFDLQVGKLICEEPAQCRV